MIVLLAAYFNEHVENVSQSVDPCQNKSAKAQLGEAYFSFLYIATFVALSDAPDHPWLA